MPSEALLSYSILRCEHYVKVYYCYSSDTHTQFTCMLLFTSIYFFMYSFLMTVNVLLVLYTRATECLVAVTMLMYESGTLQSFDYLVHPGCPLMCANN